MKRPFMFQSWCIRLLFVLIAQIILVNSIVGSSSFQTTATINTKDRNSQSDDNHNEQQRRENTVSSLLTTECSLNHRTDIPYYVIDENVLQLRYLINNSNNSNNGTTTLISMELTYNGIGWIGFAFTKSESMIPNTAIIGLPNQKQVSQFRLMERTIDGIIMIQKNKKEDEGYNPHSLVDTSIEQNETHTVLRFTKLLIDDTASNNNDNDDNVHIIPNEMNQFIWAVGVTNELAYHHTRGYDTIVLDQICNSTSSSTTSSSSSENHRMDNDDLTNTNNTTTTTTIQPPNVVVEEKQLGSIHGTYRKVLRGKIMEITLSTNTINETITIEMSYNNKGWISIGFPKDGTTRMINSIAVIGTGPLEDNDTLNYNNSKGTITKYNLTSKKMKGIFRMDDGNSLSNQVFFQNDTYTYMKFTKSLIERQQQSKDDHPPVSTISLQLDAINHFIYAVGYDNTIREHKVYGSFTAKAVTCVDGTGSTNESSSSTEAAAATATRLDCSDLIFNTKSNIPFNSTNTNTKIKWLVHGCCMVVSWILLVPIAIVCSICRYLFQLDPVIWFHIHRVFNGLAIVLTMIGFFIGLYTINEEGNGTIMMNFGHLQHHRMGLIVCIFSIVQGIGGMFRRSTPYSTTTTSIAYYTKASITNDDDDDDDNNNNNHKNNNNNNNTPRPVTVTGEDYDNNDHNKKTKAMTTNHDDCTDWDDQNGSNNNEFNPTATATAATTSTRNDLYRQRWKFIHRVCGYTILIMAWINCNSGIGLYEKRYNGSTTTTDDINITFWCIIGSIVGCTILLYSYQQLNFGCCKCMKRNEHYNKNDDNNDDDIIWKQQQQEEEDVDGCEHDLHLKTTHIMMT